MKALTICQPFAHMIALPDDHEDAKRIENRTWGTPYRRLLAIHAGKSREWLNSDRHFDEMAFGAVIAVATLRVCFEVNPKRPHETLPSWLLRDFPWLANHRHVEGPICWLLRDVRTLKEPIAYSGQQGLWDVPEELRERILHQLGG